MGGGTDAFFVCRFHAEAYFFDLRFAMRARFILMLVGTLVQDGLIASLASALIVTANLAVHLKYRVSIPRLPSTARP